MLYLRPSFTLPTQATNISEYKWDFSTLSKQEFIQKYDIPEIMYDSIADKGF